MRDAGATSTWVAGCAVHSIVLAPPGAVMLSPSEIPRNSEGAHSEGRATRGWG